MRKCYAFLFVAVAFVSLSAGCQGFKGFCDRGSLFPTRQPQLVPQQQLYTATYDTCCAPTVVTGACDPCCNSGSGMVTGSGPYSEPAYINP